MLVGRLIFLNQIIHTNTDYFLNTDTNILTNTDYFLEPHSYRVGASSILQLVDYLCMWITQIIAHF